MEDGAADDEDGAGGEQFVTNNHEREGRGDDRPLPRSSSSRPSKPRWTQKEVLPSNIERCLRDGLEWLNNEGGFEGRLIFDEVADGAKNLDEESLKRVLDDLWRMGPHKLAKPSNWLWMTLTKTGQRRLVESGKIRSNPKIERMLRQAVAWLNNDGGFEKRINLTEVLTVASSMNEEDIKSVLDTLVDLDPRKIDNPTRYVTDALRKGARHSSNGAMNRRPVASSSARHSSNDANRDGVERLLRKGIAWLNNEGGFQNRVGFREIIAVAAGVDEERVKNVLDDLVNLKPAQVQDPTQYIISKLKKHSSATESHASNSTYDRNASKRPTSPPKTRVSHQSAGRESPKESMLRQSIDWLNKSGGFKNRIDLDEVIRASAGVDDDQVKLVLDDLMELDPQHIQSPTSYICSALRRRKETLTAKRSSNDEDRRVSETDELVRKGIAWLNTEGGFDNRIKANEVASAAAGLSKQQIKEVLDKCFERNPKSVSAPTDWVCAELRKLRGGRPAARSSWRG
eukprot:TRINITY_DN73954_c0_g1_i1.p1 TRINITY_DN73954_c0_g1~~TRINITY_DN73954_c0_g1_i1.p1  ORF type:complete len:589 (-),score=86.58 TRINITY_DN73954_c0_g1_i1:85-1623(-)